MLCIIGPAKVALVFEVAGGGLLGGVPKRRQSLGTFANNADNRVSIVKAGGIAVTLSGMKAHRDHAGVWSKDQTEAIRPRKMSGKPNN